jgi:hypothetical protein
MYWGIEVELHAFLTSAPDGGEWSVSCLGCFTSGERAPSTHWTGGWAGPRADLNVVKIEKIPFLANSRTLVIHTLAYSLY